MNDYVVWQNQEIPHGLALGVLKGVDKDVELRLGIPVAESFPSDAVFLPNPDFPNDIALADSFDNQYRLVVVSQKLKDFIASFEPPSVEFLPVALLDHKSRTAGKYFIVHPIVPVDALDPTASGAKFGRVSKTMISRVDKVVFHEDKLDRSRLLFKTANFYNVIFIRRDLADAIGKSGFTGIKWVECENFKSI